MPFTRLGLTPEGGSSLLLPRVAGPKLAAELLFFGDAFPSDVALRAGLINEVVADGEALSRALSYAERLREVPYESVRATKDLLQKEREQILSTIDREVRVFQERLGSDESSSIIKAMSRR
jgi:enoyl-CoA hydratase/carnithine racemase